MMDTKILREKVLDLAIRGKLVPQDPNDEPASVLLERIRQQKQQMVKDGKLKAKDIKNDTVIFVGEDNLHYEKFTDGSVKCIEDEIPFDLPEGWAWVRLVSLIEAFITGPFGSALHKSDYVADGIPLINPMNITDGKVIPIDKMQVSPETTERLSSFKVAPSDIVIARRGDMGRCAVVQPAQKGWLCGTGSFILRFPAVLCSEYFAVCLRSPYSVELMSGNSIGNTMLNLNQTILKSILIPVPPCTEQNRIINAIFDADALLAEIANQSESLVMCVAKTKAKILDLAIRGQLVPQEPNDEPASVLLEHIRAEKEELIKQGKIKRDKKESVIFRGEDNSYYEKIGNEVENIDGDIPFELPDGWAFVRLKELWELVSGQDLSPSEYNADGDGIPYITGASNFANGRVSLVRWTTTPQVITKTGDLLLTCKGTIGEMAFNNFGDAHIARQVMAIRNTFALNPEYLALCITAYISAIKDAAKGLIPGISRGDILNLILPIPSLNYQIRVVEQVAKLKSLLTSVEKSLS